MAIKVIKHGTKVFRVVCPICGCEFEYEYEDLKTEYGFVRQVKCPDCGNFVTHQDFTPQQPHIPTYPNYPLGPAYPTYPYVTWTTTGTGTELDCDKCPNKPNPDKPVVGDSPCTWCPKMQPYCTTTFSVDGNNTNVKIDPELYKNTTTSYTDLKVNTDYSDIKTNYTTDLTK